MILIIYGSHGLAKEVHVIAKKINRLENRWDKMYFLDDFSDEDEVNGVEVTKLDKILAEYNLSEIEGVVGVGEPAIREVLYNKLKEAGIKIVTLLHPGTYVDETTTIGEGVIVCEGTTITSNVSIGVNTYIQPHCVVGHEITIGSHSVIGSNSQIGGAATLGDRVFFGFLSGTVENVVIGNDVIIAAGSVVFKDLPDEVIAVGSPARIMKKNEDKRVFKK